MTGGREDGDTPPLGTPADASRHALSTDVAPAGWYRDPWAVGQHRFWTGESWTADVFPNGPAGADVATSPWIPPAVSRPVPGPEAGSVFTPPPPGWLKVPHRADGAQTGSSDETLLGSGWGGPPTRPMATRPDESGWPTPSPAASPPPRSGRGLAVVALVVGLIVGFVAVVGFDLARRGRSTAGPAAAPSEALPSGPGATTPAPAAPTDPSSAALSSLVVQQADVPSTVVVQPLPGGTMVAGQPTLDLCNGAFPSESLRTARLQVAAIDSQANALLSTEAVLYASPAGAAQAFAELRAVVSKCPATPVASPVGEPTVTTRFNPTPDAAWPQTPGVERLAFDFSSTDQSGQAQHEVGVYLRRGRVLMGVYFQQPDGSQPAVSGQTSLAGIVSVFAARMARLTASIVNGG